MKKGKSSNKNSKHPAYLSKDRRKMGQVRIMELRGTYKGGGGPDKTILLSAHGHNKDKFFILVTYLRDPKDNDFQIGTMAKDLDISDYVEVIDRRVIDLKCIFQLNRLIKRYEIHIVHVHDLKTTFLGVFLKMLNPKVNLIHTAHGWILNSKLDGLKQKLQFFMFRFYPMHIAVSEATKKRMVESGLKSSKIRTLYNAIDTKYWKRDKFQSTVRSEFGINHEKLVIGTVGRLSREKDLPTFIQVANKVLNIYPEVYFLIVGDGKEDMVTSLRCYVKEIGIDKSVIFTGHRTDLKNIYSAFDLFLTTSLTEGLPNTVLEAMALEVPIISTSVGGVPELVVDGKTGFLCKVGDIESIAEKTMELIKNKALRENFARAAREGVERKFSFKKRLQLIEEYYLNQKNNT